MMARAFVQAGHTVHVVGVYPHEDSCPVYEEDQGVQVRRLRTPAFRFGWVIAHYQLFRKIADLSRRGEIDLVEVPDYQGFAAGWPGLPIPVITRLHGSSSYFAVELGQPVKRNQFRLERSSLHRSDFWCSVSRYTAEKTQALFGLNTPPTAILYNPVELPLTTTQKTRSRNQIVFSGTLTERKGVIPLIKAWSRVVESCPAAELHVFGKPGRTNAGQPMQDYLVKLLDEQTARSVYFHGHVSRADVLSAFQTARAAIFPSYAEAFALAPMEAMAAGCPTISSTRSSGPELIDHGRDGLLVDPDQIDQIADSLIGLLSDSTLAETLGEAGRQRVARSFSMDKILAQNQMFYSRCIENFQTHLRDRSNVIQERT
jgi:glycosyltransferase involved in cell wall biosynthesis